jgi:hypothetical protein
VTGPRNTQTIIKRKAKQPGKKKLRKKNKKIYEAIQ